MVNCVLILGLQEEDSLDDSSDTTTEEKPSRKLYYKLEVFPGKWISILYDRLTLMALLDRSEIFCCILTWI